MLWTPENGKLPVGVTLYCGDSTKILKTLPDCSVQCCVTSPPYWALRDYGVKGQMGLERTPEEFVANMVALFREVRRVLRDDGTCWINIGDSYASGTAAKKSFRRDRSDCVPGKKQPENLKAKDMVGIPWMLAFALRSDGWYLRQDIVWFKKSPMPESVRDRCTKAHEYIFLLSKSANYFYDHIGSQEETTGNNEIVSRRNMRSVWPLSAYPLKSAHFAAYPPELVRKCLTAATSEKGCCSKCGKCLIRTTETNRVPTRPGTGAKSEHPKNWKADNFDAISQRGSKSPNRDPKRHVTETVTTGWKPTCDCNAGEPIPCVMIDPFHGAGTSMKVCERLGVNYIGIELNPDYLQLSLDRPPVKFPHETKKTTKKRKHKTTKAQMELFP